MGQLKKEQLTRFLISLCIAIFTWGYVTNMHDPVQTKTLTNVPINIQHSDVLESQNLAIDTNSLSSVNVVIEGRYSEIQNASIKDVDVTLNLNDLALKEGSNTILIDAKSNNKNIKIVKEKTSLQIKVDIVKLLQKEVPVVVNVVGDLPPNYIAGEPIVSKDKVIVTGTKDSLNNIKYVSATVEFKDATKDITTLAQLKAINKVGEEASNVTLKDKEIELTVPVKYRKEVPVKLQVKNETPRGYKLDTVTLDKTSITILGPKDVLDKIKYIETEALDLSRRYYDFDKKLNLVFPEYVESQNNLTSVYGSFIVTKK